MLDPELGRRIDGGPGRTAFVEYFIANRIDVHNPDPFRPWEAFVKQQVVQAMDDGDLPSFVGLLQRDAWLLSHASVKFQIALIERTAATLKDRTYALNAGSGKRVWSFPDGKYSPLVTDGKRPYLIGNARVYGMIPRGRSR